MATSTKKCTHDGHQAVTCLLNVLNCLTKCECGQESGSVVLAYGKHEVSVATAQEPKRVLLSASNGATDTPVCQGDVNMLGYVAQPGGFVLYADIKTNTSQVDWVVEY